jgi:hypothetical protein
LWIAGPYGVGCDAGRPVGEPCGDLPALFHDADHRRELLPFGVGTAFSASARACAVCSAKYAPMDTAASTPCLRRFRRNGSTSAGTGASPVQDSRNTQAQLVVLYEQGRVEQRVVHDLDRVEARRAEREMQLMAQRYAVYAQNTAAPMPFEKFVDYMRRLTGGQ